jgi:hypothetical protein
MHHLIFEGPELAGKSWLMSQVYEHLEPKYNSGEGVLDGCHWFNCDVGVFGTGYGQAVVENYLAIFETLKAKNLLIEKLHLADKIYSRLHRGIALDYSAVEDKLAEMGFRIVLITFPEERAILEKRIRDRLNLYPHYERILQSPDWYLNQQAEYKGEIERSKLPHLVIKTEVLPDYSLVDEILKWIGEK